MKKQILKLILISIVVNANNIIYTQTMNLFSTYNSIGVMVYGNINNSDSCVVEYKETGQSKWLKAFQSDKVVYANLEQFRGSVFLLNENTSYDVKATLYNGANGTVLNSKQIFTKSSPHFNLTNNIKWVSPLGNGNFTQGNPGNLGDLFSSGQVTCGVTVVLTDGIYKDNGLQLSLLSNCSENNPILMIAAPGAYPIIDGGVKVTSNLTLHSSIPNLYSTNLPPNAEFTNTCVLGKTNLYPYPSVTADIIFGNYNLANLNFGYSGFVRDGNTLWIKTIDGINPNDSDVFVSTSFRFLTVYGNNKDAFLKIKGIEFRNFGKSILNSIGSTPDSYLACVFDIRNAHQIYFDSCLFFNNTTPISFTSQCNHILVQNSFFKNEVGKWTHAMIKKSHVFAHSIFKNVPSSRGRGIENPAIFFQAGHNIVVRYNYFDGVNSGVESYYDYGEKDEIDINNNFFIDNFDAIECDGYWCNLRAWKNEIVRPMAGISASPPLIGPRYFYRNLIHGMQGRRNEQDDPYFTGCFPVTQNYMSQGVGLKTNPKWTGQASELGNLYLINNTFHSEDTLGFVMTSWESEWIKAVFINNSYTHKINYPFFYFSLANSSVNSNFQLTSIHENYYSFSAQSPIVKIKKIHGQYDCTEEFDVFNLQNKLSSISGSNNILVQNPIQKNPQFNNTEIGGFKLEANSSLINSGKIVIGFYDFKGIAPDIGAFESNDTTINSNFKEINFNEFFKIFPNPNFGIISFSSLNEVSKFNIEVFNVFGQKIYSKNDFGIDETLNIESFSNGFYFIKIEANETIHIFKLIKQ